MKESNLVEGFEQNKQEEKEEISKYGQKKKQKEKNKIHLIITIVLIIVLFFAILYILNLYNELARKEFDIIIKKEDNHNLLNSLRRNKKDIDKMGAQNMIMQNSASALLNRCAQETNTLNNEINELKVEIEENEKYNKKKMDELIQKSIDISKKYKNIDDNLLC